MADIMIDSFTDSIKLVPFLYLTYLVIEWITHRGIGISRDRLTRAKRLAPVAGAITGVIPQCGMCAAAANLYCGGVITTGTLLAVFLASSDEMLPVMIAQSASAGRIVKILAAKVIFGAAAGLLTDLFIRPRKVIPQAAQENHSHHQAGIRHMLLAALSHTAEVFVYIFVITLALNAVIALIGEAALSAVFSAVPVAGQLIAAAIGLIPNCASSVAITQLYLSGVIGAGPMMAGLLTNSGVGVLVLARGNSDRSDTLKVIGILYSAGVICGCLTGFFGINF